MTRKRLKPVWNDEWITVVGVVGDVKYDGLASEIEPEIYRPFLQAPARNMSPVVRAVRRAARGRGRGVQSEG